MKQELSKARQVLKKYNLCPNCLGRQFPNSESNYEKGLKILKELEREFSYEDCFICKGLMGKVNELVAIIMKEICDYEFDTFLIGSTLPYEYIDREDFLRAEFKLKGGRSIKAEINSEIGKVISKKMGKDVSFLKPDLMITLAPNEKKVLSVKSKPIYLLGKYIKKVRGLKQKSKICKICKGKGCPLCNYAGYEEKCVASILNLKIKGLFKADKVRFTWFGSEDKNSLVLGNGRPFYAEVIEPKVRRPNFNEVIKEELDGIKLKSLEILDSKPKKIPEFKVELILNVLLDKEVSKDMIKNIEGKGFEVKQLVSKGKSIEREISKKVYWIRFEKVNKEARIRMLCDGGLHIKSFIRGREGSLSLSSLLNTKVRSNDEKPFDILKIEIEK
jgi:tRNA pseudouridine synthase 10